MPDPLTIDGSQGEGGGQVLRTALGLAMLTQQPARIHRIRAKRSKPGLMRQHLACVRAACLVSNGSAEGDEVGSGEVTFTPGPIAAGQHRIDIGSAGSTTLVLQTVLPALLLARSCGGPVGVTVTGGTHNPLAPPAPFFGECFVPVLRAMGADVGFACDRPGFFPRGGGVVRLDVTPVEVLQPLDLLDAGENTGSATVEVLLGSLPIDVADRELEVLRKGLNKLPPEAFTVRQLPREVGPANAVVARVPQEKLTHIAVALGERGRSAHKVANDLVSQLRSYFKHRAPVGPHLADQLLIPLALAGGRFRTAGQDAHAETNAAVIKQMIGVNITSESDGDTTKFRVDEPLGA
jgi:RNA 3'-terminal phosphate cyclase (ATP)